jgi:hypothetical protein
MIVLLHALLAVSSQAAVPSLGPREDARDSPPMPYVAQDASTFECCQHGPWRAIGATTVAASTAPGAKIAFTVKPADTVRALRGVVITSMPGVARVIKAVTLGYRGDGKAVGLSLKPGDTLITLYPMGEAYDRFWYQGNFYDDEIDMPKDGFGSVSFTGFLKVESRPRYVWWVQVSNAQGIVGWLANPKLFDGMDSCG